MKNFEVLFASSNPGKIEVIQSIGSQYGINIHSPKDFGLNINVAETGKTFAENAALKVDAYTWCLKDPGIWVIGDDSGIEIPALNNQPGVFTRRWAGHEMTDAEIINYCLEKMSPYTGAERTASFITVLALGSYQKESSYYEGRLKGEILVHPAAGHQVQGLPFNGLFYIPEINKTLMEIYGKSLEERNGFLTHRERAFHKLFGDLKFNYDVAATA